MQYQQKDRGSGNQSGAFLGRKSWYRYTDNEGKDYKRQTFDYLAEPVGLERNDSFDALPRNIKPRYVLLQSMKPASDGSYKQKKLVIQPGAFQNGGVVTIAGMEMTIIAFIAEKKRGGRNRS